MVTKKIRPFFLLTVFLILYSVKLYSIPGKYNVDASCATVTSNYSLSFQGDGYVSLPTFMLSNPGEFTVEAWVKPLSQGPMNGMVFYNGQGGEIELEVTNDLSVAFLINLDTWYTVVSSTKLVVGQWTHIAGTYKRSEQKLKLFINGILNASASTPNLNFRSSGYNSMIGSYGDASIQKYKGNIDEVRFSNVAKYTTNFFPRTDLTSDANTIGLWKFNEGIGTITYDASGNGYNGTLVKAQWSSDCPVYPPDGLVAYYPFNGNANDESGNGNNCSVTGATLTSDRFGISNSAYNFNGINNFISGDASGYPTGERTVSLWFFTNDLSNGRALLSYGGDPCGTSWTELINNQDGALNTLEFQSHCRVNRILYSYTNPPINQWFHWVITTSSSGTKMYLNGNLISSNATFVNNTNVFGKNFAIGVEVSSSGIAPYTDQNATYFSGRLDDIRIYNRALTSTEIQSLYHEGGWQQFTITTSSNPSNAGSTSGSGVYTAGTNVLVVANPNSGYTFANWTENGNVVSTNQNYQFVVTANRNLVANFTTTPTLSVSPLYVGVSSNAGSGQFNVSNTTGGTMNWSALSNTNWLTITGGSSGTNNGVINFSYLPNSNGSSRTGTITVTAQSAIGSPQTVEVRQDKIVGVKEEKLPEEFALYQNYPNPFNPTTTINYSVASTDYIQIRIYNSLGQLIKMLVNETKLPGFYSVIWNGKDDSGIELTSGVYVYQLHSQKLIKTKKLVLLK